MLNVGQVFNKPDGTYCLIELLKYSEKKYALFMKETDKVDYIFYEVNEDNTSYNLSPVIDNELNSVLFKLIEEGYNEL